MKTKTEKFTAADNFLNVYLTPLSASIEFNNSLRLFKYREYPQEINANNFHFMGTNGSIYFHPGN